MHQKSHIEFVPILEGLISNGVLETVLGARGGRCRKSHRAYLRLKFPRGEGVFWKDRLFRGFFGGFGIGNLAEDFFCGKEVEPATAADAFCL